MKILITGGAGFIGSHTAERFLEKGHQVVVLDNLLTGSIQNIKLLQKLFGNKFKFVKGDVTDKNIFKKIDKDVTEIVHLAAIVSVPRSIENPIETNDITLGGTINIFEFAKMRGIKKVVQASSAAVYGDTKKSPVKESYAGNFISPYAISKYVSEMYGEYYEKLFGIKTVSLRFFNVYGERQSSNGPYSGVIAIFVDKIKNKKDITLFGDGKNTRDFIYVKDVAEAIFSAVQKKVTKSEAYNLGSGKSVSLLEMVKTIENVFGYKVKLSFLPERLGDIKKSVSDISKIKKDLKFKPKYTLEQGLRSMLDK